MQCGDIFREAEIAKAVQKSMWHTVDVRYRIEKYVTIQQVFAEPMLAIPVVILVWNTVQYGKVRYSIC